MKDMVIMQNEGAQQLNLPATPLMAPATVLPRILPTQQAPAAAPMPQTAATPTALTPTNNPAMASEGAPTQGDTTLATAETTTCHLSCTPKPTQCLIESCSSSLLHCNSKNVCPHPHHYLVPHCWHWEVEIQNILPSSS